MINETKWKFGWYFRLLLSKLNIKRKYKIGKTHIKLDYTHKLPDNLLRFPYYDRFLPHFVKYLPINTSVVDVGANVGDTLVGMVNTNSELEYICIEPDKNFFKDLKNNEQILNKEFKNLKIHTINQFVGKELNNISLKGTLGTKSAKIGGDIKSKQLDKILSEIGINFKDISLIKTDVDGFDYDVIRSANEAILNNPFLYFECQYDNLSQFKNYKSLFLELKNKGYDEFVFFDNFGQYMCKLRNINEINDLLNYLAIQTLHGGTRTLGYYDILTYTHNRDELVSRILKDYIAS